MRKATLAALAGALLALPLAGPAQASAQTAIGESDRLPDSNADLRRADVSIIDGSVTARIRFWRRPEVWMEVTVGAGSGDNGSGEWAGLGLCTPSVVIAWTLEPRGGVSATYRFAGRSGTYPASALLVGDTLTLSAANPAIKAGNCAEVSAVDVLANRHDSLKAFAGYRRPSAPVLSGTQASRYAREALSDSFRKRWQRRGSSIRCAKRLSRVKIACAVRWRSGRYRIRFAGTVYVESLEDVVDGKHAWGYTYRLRAYNERTRRTRSLVVR